MDGFGARQRALEGSWYRQEELRTLQKRAEKLRAEGRLPHSLTVAAQGLPAPTPNPVSLLDLPTSFSGRKACEVPYHHTPSRFPAPRVSSAEQWARLGTNVSFGRTRWDVDGTSIFSVNQGKEMAQTPQRLPTAFEAKRLSKIENAALESPLVQGYRLLPQFTPGRALMWGSILAAWGTAGMAMTVARRLDIHTVDDAGGKLRAAFEPAVSLATAVFKPLKDHLPSLRTDQASAAAQADNSLAELARRLKVKMQG